MKDMYNPSKWNSFKNVRDFNCFLFCLEKSKNLSTSNRNKWIKTKLTRNFIGNSQHIMVEKSLWKEHKGVKEILAILHFLTYMYFYWKITLWSEIKEDKTQNKSLLFPGFGGQEDFFPNLRGGGRGQYAVPLRTHAHWNFSGRWIAPFLISRINFYLLLSFMLILVNVRRVAIPRPLENLGDSVFHRDQKQNPRKAAW